MLTSGLEGLAPIWRNRSRTFDSGSIDCATVSAGSVAWATAASLRAATEESKESSAASADRSALRRARTKMPAPTAIATTESMLNRHSAVACECGEITVVRIAPRYERRYPPANYGTEACILSLFWPGDHHRVKTAKVRSLFAVFAMLKWRISASSENPA